METIETYENLRCRAASLGVNLEVLDVNCKDVNLTFMAGIENGNMVKQVEIMINQLPKRFIAPAKNVMNYIYSEYGHMEVMRQAQCHLYHLVCGLLNESILSGEGCRWSSKEDCINAIEGSEFKALFVKSHKKAVDELEKKIKLEVIKVCTAMCVTFEEFQQIINILN